MTIVLRRYETQTDYDIIDSVYVDIPVFPILSDDELDVLLDACEADSVEIYAKLREHANTVLQQYSGRIFPPVAYSGELWEYIHFDNQDGFTAFILTYG